MQGNVPARAASKPFYTSKTIIVNALTVAAMVLAFLIETQTVNGLPFSLDARWLVVILGIVNIILRSATSQPVSRSKHE